jgi:hypothetical protein
LQRNGFCTNHEQQIAKLNSVFFCNVEHGLYLAVSNSVSLMFIRTKTETAHQVSVTGQKMFCFYCVVQMTLEEG